MELKTYKDTCQYKHFHNRMLYHILGLTVFAVVIVILSIVDIIEVDKKFGIAFLIVGLVLIVCFSGPIIIYNAIRLRKIAKDDYEIREVEITYISDADSREFYITVKDREEEVQVTVYKIFLDPAISLVQNSKIKVLYGKTNVLL